MERKKYIYTQVTKKPGGGKVAQAKIYEAEIISLFNQRLDVEDIAVRVFGTNEGKYKHRVNYYLKINKLK